jgi:plastocyanin
MFTTARRQGSLLIFGLFSMILCLVLVACGGSSSGETASATATTPPTATTAPATPTQATSNAAATISMGLASFGGNTSVTIKAGQKVDFDDSNGATHILVIGTNGQFHSQSGAPSDLNRADGVAFDTGTSQAIAFPTAGTYKITCKIHPNMQATVTVTK